MQVIQQKIYEIRGQRVMLDFDLAMLYRVETKRLKEQVKRNIERFPEDFMFVLSEGEWRELVANCDRLPATIKHSSALPFAFTEEGVAMLSGILRSSVAVQMNIAIMRAFVAIRRVLLYPPEIKTGKLELELKALREYVEEAFADYNDLHEDTRLQLELINQALAELQVKHRVAENVKHPPIGFIRPEEQK